jgi:hypothetical protein
MSLLSMMSIFKAVEKLHLTLEKYKTHIIHQLRVIHAWNMALNKKIYSDARVIDNAEST